MIIQSTNIRIRFLMKYSSYSLWKTIYRQRNLLLSDTLIHNSSSGSSSVMSSQKISIRKIHSMNVATSVVTEPNQQQQQQEFTSIDCTNETSQLVDHKKKLSSIEKVDLDFIDIEDIVSVKSISSLSSSSTIFPLEVIRAHENACVEGLNMYLDPETGLNVMTETYLRNRKGGCCGNACRHCPFDHINVKNSKNSKKDRP